MANFPSDQEPAGTGANQQSIDNSYSEFNTFSNVYESPDSSSGADTNPSNRKSKKVARIADSSWVNPFLKAPFQYKEAFLSLRTNISFLAATDDLKSIIITSSVPGEGKTSVAVNLALALSAANNSVLLIDADLRKPNVHKLLNITDGSKYGLTNMLYEKGATTDVCIRHRVDRKGLSVLPCGVVPPNPTELLGSARVKQLLIQLKNTYDFLIIDSPPVTVVTDAAILSQHADGILFVVRQRKVTFEQARQAKRHLNTIEANILGVVMNDFSYKYVDKSYNYYYHYY